MENITDIKFKAVRRDCSSGGFIEGYYFHIKDEYRDEHYIIESDGVQTEIYPDSLCLFTGFKDSNGVEVYTDDIIEYTTITGKKCISRIDFNNGFIAVADVNWEPVYDFFTDGYRFSNIHIIGHCGIGESDLVMDEYENDYYESCVEDQIDVDICIDKISKEWNNFQCSVSSNNIKNPEMPTADDLKADEYSKSIFSCAKNLNIKKYPPETDTHILLSKIAESFDIDDICCDQYTPFYEQVDYIIKHESNLIDKIFLDEFRANGYDTPEKIRILFDTHFWKLGDMLKNINHIISEYHKNGILNYLIDDFCAFCAPTEPVKLSDEVIELIKERMEFLYGTDTE